ncbi:MAG: ion channel [Bacteroidetes bacterium]|jgi:inward rectifier potassium channel|nr:ion channel [Bacteroidota bacterium]
MAIRIKINNSSDDLGLGTKGSDRNMNKDGSFNMERLGDPKFRSYEIFHELITMSWTKFIFLILIGYLIVNFLFAGIFFFIGVEHLSGIDQNISETRKFFEAFFFSSQTLTTLGYGRVAPTGMAASSISAIESMIGLLSFALATGLLYGRFSRPQAKLLYSKNAIIAPYKGITGLMFRVANRRRNQLLEVEVELNLSYFEKDSKTRSFIKLELERTKIALFPLSWTVVHPIDENSPLYGITENEINEMKMELIVMLKAFDDTFSQTIYSRSSFKAAEIKMGRKFIPMFNVLENGKTQLDLRLIDAMEKVELPQQKILIAGN